MRAEPWYKRWATAPTSPTDGQFYRLQTGEGYVGQVGAVIGLTHHANWFYRLAPVKRAAFREPRPTKEGAHQKERHLSPITSN